MVFCLQPESIIRQIKYPKTRDIKYNMPSGVDKNSSLLVDLQGKTIQDLAADGLGCFSNQGTFKWIYSQEDSGYTCIRKKFKGKVDRQKLKQNHVVVVKTYYKHVDYTDFSRTISYLQSNRSDIVDNLAVITYTFNGPEHKILLKPHGNSKKAIGYTKTKPSVVKEVRGNASMTSVSGAVEKHLTTHGGRSAIPDELRVSHGTLYKMNSRKAEQDGQDFSAIMEWAAEHKDICRLVSSHPEPVIVLATDQQLVDLERFTSGKCQPGIFLL